MSKLKGFLAVLAALCVFAFAASAEASHFRYGNITYTKPDPVSAPLTVRFEVTMAWHKDSFIGSSTLVYGDGTYNADTQGVYIGSGYDAAGFEYQFYHYTATHTYGMAGQYTASFKVAAASPRSSTPTTRTSTSRRRST
jgi:hypothetical protein